MKAFFSPPLPDFLIYRQKDLSIPPYFSPSLQSGQLFGDFGSRLATPPNSPHVPASFLLSFSISSGKCHPRIYSFARLRRACSSHPYLSNSHFSWTSGRIKNRGGGFLLCTLRERWLTMVDRDLHGDTPWKIYPRPMASNTRGGVARQVPAVVQIDRTLKQGREGGWEGNERRSWGVAALANNSPP